MLAMFFHQHKTGLTLECECECLSELDEVDHLLMCGFYQGEAIDTHQLITRLREGGV